MNNFYTDVRKLILPLPTNNNNANNNNNGNLYSSHLPQRVEAQGTLQ